MYSQVSLIPAHTLCFTQELYAFMSTQPVTQLVVDRSTANELLKINFNIRCVNSFLEPSRLWQIVAGPGGAERYKHSSLHIVWAGQEHDNDMSCTLGLQKISSMHRGSGQQHGKGAAQEPGGDAGIRGLIR